MKKVKYSVICILMVMLLFALPVTGAYADTPENMTRPQVIDRLDLLYEQLGGKYFTTTQKASPSDSDDACAMVNVIKKDWLKKATNGMVPEKTNVSGTFTHYFNGDTWVRGKSCCGFANYAQWYVFAQDSKDIVKTKEVDFVEFNKNNMTKYAQPGDVIRIGKYKESDRSTHSAIIYSINDTTITVIDSNWTNRNDDKCKVTKHDIKYTSYDWVGIGRATNYDYPTGHYVIEDTSSGTLNMRDGATSNDTVLAKVPEGTEVKIVETKGNWGKYEYNGITGWSNLDYMYFGGTYINTVTFDANGGSGTMEPFQFDIGVGFNIPKCAFTKEGYHFTGWYMELDGTGHWRCKDPVANKLDWLTESEIKGNFRKHLYPADSPSNMQSHILKGGTYIMHAQWEQCTYGDPVIEPATPGKNGSRVYICETCKGTYTEIIPALRLDAPTNVKINTVASSGKLKISWNTVENADKYYVYRSTMKTGPYSYLRASTTNSYTDTSAVGGKVYYYKVRAVYSANENANSVQSGYVYERCKLAQPTSLKISTVASSGKLKISWNTVENADKYYVYRSATKTGPYSYLRASTTNSYTDTSAVGGKIYYYKIRAVYSANENANSVQSSYVYERCKLAQPTGLKISTVASTGKPIISWNAVESADKYYVYRSTTKEGTYSYLRAATTTSYVDTSAVGGKVYYYKVRAVYSTNENANSVQSSYVYDRCKQV